MPSKFLKANDLGIQTEAVIVDNDGMEWTIKMRAQNNNGPRCRMVDEYGTNSTSTMKSTSGITSASHWIH